MPSHPGSVGLARAHPLAKAQAIEPSRQTWSSYGPPHPLGRWSPAYSIVWAVVVAVVSPTTSSLENVEALVFSPGQTLDKPGARRLNPEIVRGRLKPSTGQPRQQYHW